MTVSKPVLLDLISRPAAPPDRDRELCLLPAFGLSELLHWARKYTIDGRSLDEDALAQRWRDALDALARIKEQEPGAGDDVAVLPLSAALDAHVRKLAETPMFQSVFSAVPVAFGMVELDTLVVYQPHLTGSSIDKMLQRPAGHFTDAELAGICLPLTSHDAGFKVAYEDGKKFVFLSDTHDTRFLGAQLLKPAEVSGLALEGHAQAVIALSIGFTTNILNVVRYRNRMVLNNGYHRAWALRQMGVTHAPCLIQVCAHWGDVEIAASREVCDDEALYFASPRPTLLRDFGNPLLTASFETRRLRREIRVKYEVDSLQLEI